MRFRGALEATEAYRYPVEVNESLGSVDAYSTIDHITKDMRNQRFA